MVRLLLAAVLLCVCAPRTDSALAEDSAGAAVGVRSCLVSGRVVDEDMRAVAGANVTWIGDVPAGDGSSAAAVQTDATGAFRLTVKGPADTEIRGTIYATRGDKLAGVLAARMPTGLDAQNLGALQLTQAQPLAVDVRSAGAPVAKAVVWAWTWTGNLYHGLTVHLGTATTGPEGRALFGALPHGYFRLLARAPDGSQTGAMRQVVLGHSISRIRMNVVPTRAVHVRVVDATDAAKPIEGAIVTRDFKFAIEDVSHSLYAHLPERIPLTSSDGYAQVKGLPSNGGASLVVRAPGRPMVRAYYELEEATTTIVVPDPIEIQVNKGERPAPPDGTKLLIRPRRSREPVVEGWMRNGAIVAPMRTHALNPGVAVAPDGSIAPLHRLEATSFYAPRSLSLRIVEEGDARMLQTHVSIAPVPYIQGPWEVPVQVDSQGRARFDALPPWTYRVYGFPTARSPHGRSLGKVDLSAGDVTKDLVVGKERVLRLRMRVDNRPGIPQAPWWNVVEATEVGAEVDRAANEIRLRIRPKPDASGGGSIELGGRGVRSHEVTFAWPAGGETGSIDINLRSAPQVVAEVREDPDSETDVYVEKWCPGHGETAWWAAHSVYPHLRGRTTLHLDKGRYRLHDASTGIVSVPFEVPEYGGSVHAPIDLTNLVTIRGRIACPEGTDRSDLTVGLEGDGIDSHLQFTLPFGRTRGLSCDNGRFAVRVPAGVAVTLRPCHPNLLPARVGGEVTLAGPRDEVVLNAAPGATVLMKLVDVDGAPLLRGVAVYSIPPEHPTRPPVRSEAEPVEGRPGHYSASGLPFGTIDLWVVEYSQAHAAALRKGVRIDRETVDLGEVKMPAGSRVLVRRIDRQGKSNEPAIGEIKGYAVGQFGPRKWRISTSSKLPDVLCQFTGLSAGRWHITLNGTPAAERTFEIEVDGKSDKTLEVDFSR